MYTCIIIESYNSNTYMYVGTYMYMYMYVRVSSVDAVEY